ncbi:amphi-Trp domain-containing protein [Streptomyces sp. NPDC008122]|uniref:amphi-Trp domain-containing protein n=1 Tax=Streptomyces sp. NPDC008122 TaxID=3364810 RepID=UPI0036E61CE5
MSDLKFEQKSTMSRTEAAAQLEALAAALREGGEADLPMGLGVLSLKIPDELRTEVEFEVGDGEIELEIELKWPVGGGRAKPKEAKEAKEAKEPEAEVKAKPEPKKPVAKPEPKKPEVKAPAKPEPKKAARSGRPAAKRT